MNPEDYTNSVTASTISCDLNSIVSVGYDADLLSANGSGPKVVRLDDNMILEFDNKQIAVKDLFKKLDILDRIIKQHYPEELLK